MMAILILMVGMLGLLQAINLAIEVNLRNQVREEAVYIGEKVMNELRGKLFEKYSANYATYNLPSKIRGASRSYSVKKEAKDLTADAKELRVTISWEFKGVTYENRVVAPISILR